MCSGLGKSEAPRGNTGIQFHTERPQLALLGFNQRLILWSNIDQYRCKVDIYGRFHCSCYTDVCFIYFIMTELDHVPLCIWVCVTR